MTRTPTQPGVFISPIMRLLPVENHQGKRHATDGEPLTQTQGIAKEAEEYALRRETYSRHQDDKSDTLGVGGKTHGSQKIVKSKCRAYAHEHAQPG